jgi:hypothetical protein
MPFGRFKGVLVADLDDDYLRWLRDAIELREPLRTVVHAEYRHRFAKPADQAVPQEVRTMAAELITAGYRRLALQYHPDHGGETKSMQLVNRAADFLRQITRAT